MDLPAVLARFAPMLPVAVAYSGGADSTAMLAAAAAAWPGGVRAIHIHHGLQSAADAFEAHCRKVCEALKVPLDVIRVSAKNSKGESPEDAARVARYAALAECARGRGASTVLVAQHADDQAETLLLALSRGAGLPGLAAMPSRFERHGISFARPFLEVPGHVLRQWVADRKLPFIDDPTNSDVAFTRNRIRHQVLPAIEQAFPHFRETFARTARHAAQAQALLAEVAAQDLQVVGSPPVIAELRALSRIRQANLLRHWLREAHSSAASAAQLDELLDQVEACATRGHRIEIKVGEGFVRREGEVLRFSAGQPPGDESAQGA